MNDYLEKTNAAYDRYDAYLRVLFDNAASMSEFGPGKIFSLVVADTKAYYIVTDCDDKTATIEYVWPENEEDDEYIDLCTDPFLRTGGTFDRDRIEPLCGYHDNLTKIFGGNK